MGRVSLPFVALTGITWRRPGGVVFLAVEPLAGRDANLVSGRSLSGGVRVFSRAVSFFVICRRGSAFRLSVSTDGVQYLKSVPLKLHNVFLCVIGCCISFSLVAHVQGKALVRVKVIASRSTFFPCQSIRHAEGLLLLRLQRLL